MPSTKPFLLMLLALALLRGLLYASFVPPWQAPDEPAQFERTRAALSQSEWAGNSDNPPAWYAPLAQSLLTFDYYDFLDGARHPFNPQKPLQGHVALYQEAYGGLYGSRPMYALMGWPFFLARNQDITLQLYLARLNTVLMNVGIIWLAWLICRAIFPTDNFLAVGVPALILFNPQHTHMLSTINNGNLAELLAAAALYFLVRGIVGGFSWINLGAVLLFSAAAVWTKATAYFLPAAIGAVGLFYLWQYRRHWRWFLPALLGLAAAAYLLAPARLKLLVRDSWIYWQTQGFDLDPIVPQDLFRGFWAMPGWTIFYLHPLWYQIIGLFCGLALAGLLLAAIIHRHKFFNGQYRPQLQALAVLAVAALTAIGILLAWNGLTHSIVYRQGRSIYPVIIPLSLFLMLGWRQLIPATWRKAGLAALVSAFFLFDTLVLFHYIIPFFYSRY